MHLPIARRAGGRTRALHRSLIGRLQNDTRPGHLPRKGDGRRLIGGPSKRRGQGDISNRCRPPVCPARAWVRARTVAAGRVSVGEQRRGPFFSQPRLVSWLSAVSGMRARPFGYFCGYLILPSTRIVTKIAGKPFSPSLARAPAGNAARQRAGNATDGHEIMYCTPDYAHRNHRKDKDDDLDAPTFNSPDTLLLGIERCRHHIRNMERQGRQHEGAMLVLNRLERRLLEVISSSAIPAMPVAESRISPR